MEKFSEKSFGGIPERFQEEGIKVHGNELAKVGDTVEAVRGVQEVITSGEQFKIAAIFVEPLPNQRGFSKEIELEGLPGKRFNPRRFRKVESSQ